MKIYYALKIEQQGQVGYLAVFGPGSLARVLAESFGQPVPSRDPEASWLWVPKVADALLFPAKETAEIIAEFAGVGVSVVSVRMK